MTLPIRGSATPLEEACGIGLYGSRNRRVYGKPVFESKPRRLGDDQRGAPLVTARHVHGDRHGVGVGDGVAEDDGDAVGVGEGWAVAVAVGVALAVGATVAVGVATRVGELLAVWVVPARCCDERADAVALTRGVAVPRSAVPGPARVPLGAVTTSDEVPAWPGRDLAW